MKKKIIMCVFVLTGCNNSDKDYKEATSLYESGNYEEAKAMFVELGDYEDSATMVKACDYAQAVKLYNSGDYESAISIFKSIED